MQPTIWSVWLGDIYTGSTPSCSPVKYLGSLTSFLVIYLSYRTSRPPHLENLALTVLVDPSNQGKRGYKISVKRLLLPPAGSIRDRVHVFK